MALPTLFTLESFTGGSDDVNDPIGPVRPAQIQLKTIANGDDSYELLKIKALVKGEPQQLTIPVVPPQLRMAWDGIKKYLLQRFISPSEEIDGDDFELITLTISYSKTPKLSAVILQEHDKLTTPIQHQLKTMKFDWSTSDEVSTFFLPIDLVQQLLVVIRYCRELFQESPCHLDLLRKVTGAEFSQMVQEYQAEVVQHQLVPETDLKLINGKGQGSSKKKSSTASRSRKRSSKKSET